MTSKNSDRRPIVAAIAASLLMLTLGLTNRILLARLSDPLSKVPIDPSALEKFPRQISDWTGQDIPLDDAIVRRTSTDAHINRQYCRANGPEFVSLYVACGIRTLEIVSHQPKACYPRNGWTLVEQHSVGLQLSDGNKLPCTILQFARNELFKERLTALHYWIADGRFCRDVPVFRLRLRRVSERADSIAQVQIVASSTGILTSDSAKRLVSSFAVDSALSMAHLFDSL